MKAITMLCFCAFAIKFSTAQNKSLFQKKATPFNTITERSFTLSTKQQATLIGQNTIGKIYVLPTDNMPCLVAHAANEALMPVYNTPLLYPGIPNGLPIQKLIAPSYNSNNKLKLSKLPSKNHEYLLQDFLRNNKNKRAF